MHPDSFKFPSKSREEKFKKITEAYSILACKDSRSKYDYYIKRMSKSDGYTYGVDKKVGLY